MPMFQTASVANIEYSLDKMSGELLALVSPYDIEEAR
jgi:phosphohistidine phosphatase